jgi:ATP-dependent DNA ligase
VAFQRKKSTATGIKAPYPGFIEPALATTVAEVPSGKRWVHEIKMDGYRVQVHLRDAVVKVYTRRGHNWTNRFRKISSDAWHVNAGSAIIDAEVVVPGADGITDFSVLQNELKGRSTKIVMVAFDLLYLNGRDLRGLPLYERKAVLKKLIADTDVQFSAASHSLFVLSETVEVAICVKVFRFDGPTLDVAKFAHPDTIFFEKAVRARSAITTGHRYGTCSPIGEFTR